LTEKQVQLSIQIGLNAISIRRIMNEPSKILLLHFKLTTRIQNHIFDEQQQVIISSDSNMREMI